MTNDGGVTITRTQVVPVEQGYWCPECLEATEEGEELEGPLYECCRVYTREDSADGDSNRCPDCNKFGAKVTDGPICPTCQEAQLEETDLAVCPECDDRVKADELQEHMDQQHAA